jgi:integrase
MSEMSKPEPMPDDPFRVIVAARAALKARREDLARQVEGRGGKAYTDPDPGTLAQYERAARRLVATGDPWAAAAETTKRSTWLARKSALLSVAARHVDALLKSQDKLQRITDKDPAAMQEWASQVVQLHTWTRVLTSKPVMDPLTKVKRRQSKRAGLSKLPENWREQLAKRLPMWRMPYLVAACTGARPAEIGYGIELKIDGVDLVATIKGAKTGPYSGQKIRELRWTIEKDMPELVRQLAKEVRTAGDRLVVDYSGRNNPDPAKAFSGAMRQAGKRAFPGHKLTLTPYSLRHSAGSDLKDSGLSDAQQSAALGHQVSATKSTYGHHSMAKGRSVAPKTVQATTAVRGAPTEPPRSGAHRANKKGPSQGSEFKAR